MKLLSILILTSLITACEPAPLNQLVCSDKVIATKQHLHMTDHAWMWYDGTPAQKGTLYTYTPKAGESCVVRKLPQ